MSRTLYSSRGVKSDMYLSSLGVRSAETSEWGVLYIGDEKESYIY